MTPLRAEERAAALKPQHADGWEKAEGGFTAKQEAMHCFSAESAGLVGYLMIHEIVGRNELWADPRFQARHHRHSHMLPRL